MSICEIISKYYDGNPAFYLKIVNFDVSFRVCELGH